MFRASSCPSSGEQDCLIPLVVMPVCAGCGLVEPGLKQYALCTHGAYCLRPGFTRQQPAQPGITTSGIKQSCSPDDGHDDARNMLRDN
jgi:hypothetical protein